jgi:hypothetical protein
MIGELLDLSCLGWSRSICSLYLLGFYGHCFADIEHCVPFSIMLQRFAQKFGFQHIHGGKESLRFVYTFFCSLQMQSMQGPGPPIQTRICL